MFVKPGEDIVQHHTPMVIMLEGDGPLEALVEKAKAAPPMGARPRRTHSELLKLPTRPVCPKGHTDVQPRIMEYGMEEWYCVDCCKGFNEPGVQIIALPERVRRSYGELNSIHFTKRPSCPELHGPHRIEPRSDSDFFHEWYCCECSKDYHKRTGSYYEGFNEPGVKLIHPDEAKRRGIS